MKKISDRELLIIEQLIADGIIPKKDVFNITKPMIDSYVVKYSEYYGGGKLGCSSNKKYAEKLACLTLLKLVRQRLPENSENKKRNMRAVSKAGFIYILYNESYKDVFKLGITRDLSSRLQIYLTSDPYKTSKFIYTKFSEDIEKLERKILVKNTQYIISGEWFYKDKMEDIINDIKCFG